MVKVLLPDTKQLPGVSQKQHFGFVREQAGVEAVPRGKSSGSSVGGCLRRLRADDSLF